MPMGERWRAVIVSAEKGAARGAAEGVFEQVLSLPKNSSGLTRVFEQQPSERSFSFSAACGARGLWLFV